MPCYRVIDLHRTHQAAGLDAVGSYILHGGGPHVTGNQGEILGPIPTILHTKRYKVVPAHTCADPHAYISVAAGGFPACVGAAEHAAFDCRFRKQQVAAGSYREPGLGSLGQAGLQLLRVRIFEPVVGAGLEAQRVRNPDGHSQIRTYSPSRGASRARR